MNAHKLLLGLVLATTPLLGLPAHAAGLTDADMKESAAQIPAGTNLVKGSIMKADIAYGSDALQKFDVYIPQKLTRNAPIVLYVHGGGWRQGDKTYEQMIVNKGAFFIAQGFIFISTNYRLLPSADPYTQAQDVAKALAMVQKRASLWGGDASKIVLMGHSAGAHLVALLTADPTLAKAQGATPWRGTVALDSGTLNVPETMLLPHLPLFNDAFGKNNPIYWKKTSPQHQLSKAALPMMAVCSTERPGPCPQAAQYARQAKGVGAPSVNVLEVAMSHKEINDQLGLSSAYTLAVGRYVSELVK